MKLRKHTRDMNSEKVNEKFEFCVVGLGMLSGGPPLELNSESFLSHAFNGAVYVSENLLIFLFAAVGLDFCFKMRLLSSFPMKKRSASASESDTNGQDTK